MYNSCGLNSRSPDLWLIVQTMSGALRFVPSFVWLSSCPQYYLSHQNECLQNTHIDCWSDISHSAQSCGTCMLCSLQFCQDMYIIRQAYLLIQTLQIVPINFSHSSSKLVFLNMIDHLALLWFVTNEPVYAALILQIVLIVFFLLYGEINTRSEYEVKLIDSI